MSRPRVSASRAWHHECVAKVAPRWMDYRMQAGDEAVNGSPTLRIGERHAPSKRSRKSPKRFSLLTFVLIGGALASICRRPASLDLGLAFRWPISRARRQMRGDRIKCLGLRTYRTSCINATDSICRRARMESQRVGRGRRPRRPATAIKRKSRCGAVAGGRGRPPLPVEGIESP